MDDGPVNGLDKFPHHLRQDFMPSGIQYIYDFLLIIRRKIPVWGNERKDFFQQLCRNCLHPLNFLPKDFLFLNE
jgi:hypothetical protein